MHVNPSQPVDTVVFNGYYGCEEGTLQSITQAELSRRLGISKQAVTKAIQNGRCPTVGTGRARVIDLDDQRVKDYIASVRKRTKPTESAASALEDTSDNEMDLKTRKLAADAALQEVKLQTAGEQYLTRVGAVIDVETLRRKMSKFTDVLVTHLIYLPEEIADTLWTQAAASDNPERVIRELLADRHSVIIREAKQAAAEIAPPRDNRKYIIVDNDE